MLRFGFAKEDITPARGIPLCGYFNPRPNTGARDPLALKAAVFECAGTCAGIVSFDLCLIPYSLVKRCMQAVAEKGLSFGKNIIFSATHTHTGPYTAPLFDGPVDEDYNDMLVKKTADALERAYRSLADAELFTGKAENASLAFNRRFWMKDGTVLTNPGKLNPEILKPESVIDPEIPFMVVKQDGMDRLIIANISNHTDTIGDDFVSADWPGRMEREIQNCLGSDVPVMTLIGCQGNINHFNVENNADQTCYAEACRIGKAYAGSILSMLYAVKKVNVDTITFRSAEMEMPVYKVTDAEYDAAKKIVAEFGDVKAESASDQTSEGIAAGNAYVKVFFAKRLIENRENPLTENPVERMCALCFGDTIGISTLPAEPFVELGLAIKKLSEFPVTMPVGLAMGYIGYTGMPECYERGGGYETRPSRTAPSHDLAPKLIAQAVDLLNR